MKRKLFIGSSFKNGLDTANKVKELIDEKCKEWLECDVWYDSPSFEINESTLDSLITSSRKYDYGIFVATKDDKVNEGANFVPRDNVVFEMGLFMGGMGKTRSFFLVEKDVKLPSDFLGITMPIFNKEDNESIWIAINKIINNLIKYKDNYTVKLIPSTALAEGYYENFLLPFAKKYNEKKKKEKESEQEITLPDEITIKIIFPSKLNNYKDKDSFLKVIDKYQEKFPSDDIGIYKPNERPTIKRLKDNNQIYWDLPTTMFTLKKIFDNVLPDITFGPNEEKDNWIKSEIVSFIGLIDYYIGINTEFEKIQVEYYWIEYHNKKLNIIEI